MTCSKFLCATAGLLGLVLVSLPAAAGDFSFGFGFNTGSWRHVDCRPSYAYYEPAPVVYRDYAYEPDVVVVRSTPCVVYEDYSVPTVVYRDRTPRVYYRDYSPPVVYRDCAPRVYDRDCTPRVVYRDRSPRSVVVRDCAPRVHRTTRTYVTGSHYRGYEPSRCYTTSHRAYRTPRHVAPCPPRHSAGVRVRW